MRTENELINNVGNLIIHMYREECYRHENQKMIDGTSVNYTVKREGENKGQYGYYITTSFAPLLGLLDKLKTKSLIDLGSGAGILLKVLKIFRPEIQFSGYEIEDSLITYATRLGVNTIKKDILKLESYDLGGCDTIYFWEPLHNDDLAKKFVDNLLTILTPKHTIIYLCAGQIGKWFHKSGKVDMVKSGYFDLITLKK